MQDASSSTVCFYDSMMPYTFHHCSCRGFAKFQEPPESSHQRIRSKPSRCIIISYIYIYIIYISYYIHHHVYHHVLSCDIMSGGQDDLDVDGCGVVSPCISCVFKWTFSGSTSFTMAFLENSTGSSGSPRFPHFNTTCSKLFQAVSVILNNFERWVMNQNMSKLWTTRMDGFIGFMVFHVKIYKHMWKFRVDLLGPPIWTTIPYRSHSCHSYLSNFLNSSLLQVEIKWIEKPSGNLISTPWFFRWSWTYSPWSKSQRSAFKSIFLSIEGWSSSLAKRCEKSVHAKLPTDLLNLGQSTTLWTC